MCPNCNQLNYVYESREANITVESPVGSDICHCPEPMRQFRNLLIGSAHVYRRRIGSFYLAVAILVWNGVRTSEGAGENRAFLVQRPTNCEKHVSDRISIIILLVVRETHDTFRRNRTGPSADNATTVELLLLFEQPQLC